MRDSATGRSRGFGFLTFRDPKTVNTVMVKEHYLDGKIVSQTMEDVVVTGQKEHDKSFVSYSFPKLSS
jgi:RNA recognition motif-containing protein